MYNGSTLIRFHVLFVSIAIDAVGPPAIQCSADRHEELGHRPATARAAQAHTHTQPQPQPQSNPTYSRPGRGRRIILNIVSSLR